jgi:selenocysteine-specific elongation factor
MIIGTAGHIDHGKTALVRALTGVDADRLPEEKRRGMTIDLGFAYRAPPAIDGAYASRDGGVLGFIDVPGHERFIHNMLAGVTGIDFVLLVVAADDGPMPQTREHLDIVSLLGVKRGVVALTKSDLVAPDRLIEAELEIRDLLRGSALQDAAIMPVSAVTGQGIAELDAYLTDAALALDALEPQGEFRMAVDRSFVFAGVGVVVTGTVGAGRISVGERAVLTPSGIEVRVRSIHTNNRKAQTGQKGDRCALNIAGPQVDRERAQRGDWVVAPSLHMPTDRLDARLRLLGRTSRGVRPGFKVHLHLGAARVGARLLPFSDTPLQPGIEHPVQLVLDQAIGAWRGDRFIVRDASATRTIGGGIVLDPGPPARWRRRPERLRALAALAQPKAAASLAGLLEISAAGVDLDRFAAASGLTAGEAHAAWREAGARVLKADGRRHGFAISPSRLGILRHRIEAALSEHHRTAPASPGPTLDQLRLALGDRLPPASLRAIVEALVEERGLALSSGTAIHLPGHCAGLPSAQAALWTRIRESLEIHGFAGAWVRDLAAELSVSETAMRQLMKQLGRMGEVVEVAPDRFYLRQTIHKMAELLAELCNAAADGTVTAAAFRDRIATGRKLAIIILEFFDRTGITIRRGDLRKVQPDRLRIFRGAARESF